MARRRYQRGSVVLVGSNRWVLRWREDVIDEAGLARRVQRKTNLGTLEELPTKKLAQRAAEGVLATINSLDYRPGRFATLRQFAQAWERDALMMLKPSTQRVHLSYLRAHLLPELGGANLADLDQHRAQAFVARLSQKLKRKTVRNVVGVLAVLLKTAKSWGYAVGTARPIDLVMPRGEVKAERPSFTPDEVRAILGATTGPWLALYSLLAFTGLRSGEALAITWADLDFERRLVFVRRSNYRGHIQTVKSKASRRALPMPSPLAEAMADYRKEWRPNLGGWLFAGDDGEPMNPEAVRRWRFLPLLKRLGIRRAGFHAFRHAQASLLVSTGASVKVAQAQLGHEDVRTTLELYAHLVGDDHREASERVAAILRPHAPEGGRKLLRIK